MRLWSESPWQRLHQRIPFTYRYGNVGWRSKLYRERDREGEGEGGRKGETCMVKKRDGVMEEGAEEKRNIERRKVGDS